ncbi:hypothetical protein [Bradyrhizobium liaoningense]
MTGSNFPRVGTDHNSGVGRKFEALARVFFKTNEGLDLVESFPVAIGVSTTKKLHRFDLGSESPAVLIECKSHTWTETGNMPSAKMTVWNEAMYYFHIAPAEFRKVLFVLKHHHRRRELSLAAYYLRTHSHMVPVNVEIWEYDTDTLLGERLR